MNRKDAISYNLRRIREEKGLKQHQVIGFSKRTISRYENGEPPENLKVIKQLADRYDVDYLDILLSNSDKLNIFKKTLMSLPSECKTIIATIGTAFNDG